MSLRHLWTMCGILPFLLHCRGAIPGRPTRGDLAPNLVISDATPPHNSQHTVGAGPGTVPPSALPPYLAAPTALSCQFSPGVGPIAVSDHELRARVTRIEHRLTTLATEVMAFWKQKGPDSQFGGFHGDLDRLGNPSGPADKGLIQQTRHLWSFSNWYERREPTPEIKAIADRQYRFIVDHYLDPITRQYYFKLDHTGTKIVDPRKTLYAESFAIYAFSTYGRVFGLAEAKDRALALFRSIDTRHDSARLGYDERNDSGWLQKGAAKSTNTHIHLMESFTALYESTRDSVVRDRLEELVRVVRTKVFQSSQGYDAKEFTNDWTPVGPVQVSYGHDLETAWLLWHAGCVLGRPDDQEIRTAALGMGLTSAAQGYDAAMGGYFEEGIPQGKVTGTDKIWWIEVESVPSLWMLYRMTGDKTLLDRLEGTLGFIEKVQRDNRHPGTEWFWGVTKDGQVNPRGDHKSEEWKASYHNSRALTLTAAWIADALRWSLPPQGH